MYVLFYIVYIYIYICISLALFSILSAHIELYNNTLSYIQIYMITEYLKMIHNR